jgi:hypothetical protein
VAADQDPLAFWKISLLEFQITLDGVADRLTRERDDRLEAAWINARLSAYPPDKPSQFVKLDKLLAGDRAKPRRKAKQDWKAQAALLENW